MPDADPLPRPFLDQPFRRERRAASEALWAFHLGLDRLAADGTRPQEAFDAAAERVRAGEAPGLLDGGVERAALAAVAEHDLPLESLAAEVAAAGDLVGGIAFPDSLSLGAFTDRWAGAHGALLAHLGGARLGLQQHLVRELARGFFLVGRLAGLRDDLARGRVYVPQDALAEAEVLPDDLLNPDDPVVQRLLWRHAVRARDALAQGLPLVDDLGRREARALRRHWLGALEVLRVLEKNGFAVPEEGVAFGPLSRLAVRLQSIFGRRSARTR